MTISRNKQSIMLAVEHLDVFTHTGERTAISKPRQARSLALSLVVWFFQLISCWPYASDLPGKTFIEMGTTTEPFSLGYFPKALKSCFYRSEPTARSPTLACGISPARVIFLLETPRFGPQGCLLFLRILSCWINFHRHRVVLEKKK